MLHAAYGFAVLRRILAFTVAACVSLALAVASPLTADAAAHGGVLVPGASWAGAYAKLGDLNVYSNGPSLTTSTPGAYGGAYQCTELARRWLAIRWGETGGGLGSAASWWTNGPSLPIPLVQHKNGGADRPQFGDILVFGATSYDKTGHVAVVTGSTATTVSLVEQNWSATQGRATIPISGTHMPARWGLPILGWLRPTPVADTPTTSGAGGYMVDGNGGLHAWGSAPHLAASSTWNFDIARAIVKQPNANAGYVLDGFGGIHPFGGAPAVSVTFYEPGKDVARAMVLAPNGVSGYVLDAFGGVHPFGGAPEVATTASWPGWSIARGIVLRADGVSGWVLDGYGGLHPFGGAPAESTGTYWNGWDIARSVDVIPGTDTGYVVDGYGGLHPFGGAPALSPPAYFPSSDTALNAVVALDPTTAQDGGGYGGGHGGGGYGGGYGNTGATVYLAFRSGIVATSGDQDTPPFEQTGSANIRGIA